MRTDCRRDGLNAIFSAMFVLLMPFLKAERVLLKLSEMDEGAMIKLYHLVMDSRHNPLSHIRTGTRTLVMQVNAGCGVLSLTLWMGSILVFGVSAAIHAILLTGIIYYSWCI